MIGMGVPIAEWNNLGKMCTKCTHSVFLKNFIYFWLCWIFTVAWAFLQLWRMGATLQLQRVGFSPGGFSCCRAQALWHVGSVVAAGVQFLPSMWDLPAPGIDPMSPTLAGGFLSTVPPGKSNKFITKDLILFPLIVLNCFTFGQSFVHGISCARIFVIGSSSLLLAVSC